MSLGCRSLCHFAGLIALINVALWLADTTRQFMGRDAQAIALDAFAQAHEPLPELLALAPAAVPLALPSLGASLLLIALAPGLELAVSDTTVSTLALCPASVPMSLHSSINPDDSVRRWLVAALPLALSSITEAATVSDVGLIAPVVAAVKSCSRKAKRMSEKIKATLIA